MAIFGRISFADVGLVTVLCMLNYNFAIKNKSTLFYVILYILCYIYWNVHVTFRTYYSHKYQIIVGCR